MRDLPFLTLISTIALLALSPAAVGVDHLSFENVTSYQAPDGASDLFRKNSTTVQPERRWHGPPPEPANDAIWERYKCKGRKLLYQMSLSDRNVAALLPNPQATVQSPYGKDTLEPWGYETKKSDGMYRDLSAGGMWGVSNFFDHLGISSKFTENGGDWEGTRITHYHMSESPWSQTEPQEQLGYKDPYNYMRRVTGAYHLIATNPHGHIIVQATKGPRSAADHYYGAGRFPDNELPEMSRLSDMIWANWESVPDKTTIQLLMSLTITNAITNSLIARAMNNVRTPLSTSPQRFFMDSDEGLALLGSPNGAAFAHFLIERKNQVGLKTIQSCWVWEGETSTKAPSLMFGVVPLSQPTEPGAGGSEGLLGVRDAGKHEERFTVREHVLHIDRSA